jgi:hypothetical protein
MWTKIKVWTKIIIFSLVIIYVLLFSFKNSDQPVSIWVWFGHDPYQTGALTLSAFAMLAGVVGTLLFRMVFRTIWQVRDMRHQNRNAQMKKDLEDLKTKAALTQTKADISSTPTQL